MTDVRIEIADRLRAMSPARRRAALGRLSHESRVALTSLWELQARPEQVWRPPSQRITVVTSGRGWGKTRMGAAATSWVARNADLGGGAIAIVGRTYQTDVIGTMLNGPSGLIANSPPDFRPRYNSVRKEIEWPNGVVCRLYSGDVPNSVRGLNAAFVWADELPHWRRAEDTWTQLMLALRLGISKALVTTTPLGTTFMRRLVYAHDEHGAIMRSLDGSPRLRDDVMLVTGNTEDNRANLSAQYIETIAEIAGTRLGRQELAGEILLDDPAACWSMDWIKRGGYPPKLVSVVVAVDPAVTSGEDSDETGIVVAGQGEDRILYVIGDYSGRMTPRQWAAKAVGLATEYRGRIVCEENQGGDLVREAIAGAPGGGSVRIEGVRASVSKRDRWTIAAIPYERGQVVHCGSSRLFEGGSLALLEAQMTGQDPDKPGRKDRADALAWAVLALRNKLTMSARAKGWTDTRIFR